MKTNYRMILSIPIERLARSPSHSNTHHAHCPSGNRPSSVFGSNSADQVREKVSLTLTHSRQLASSKSVISAGISASDWWV